MAKDLPYFKFFCSEWNDGDITLEDYHTQGVFINVCSYYWSNECDITYKKLLKRFKKETETIDLLKSEGIIKVDNDIVEVSFLDEQWSEREATSKKNSEAGIKSAEARRLKKLGQQPNQKLTPVEIPLNEDPTIKRREEKRREDINNIYSLYPSKCVVKQSSTGKSKKVNEEQIKRLLKDYSPEQLTDIITRYVRECKQSETYMKNFKTFLNNLPDYSDTKEIKLNTVTAPQKGRYVR